MPSGDVLIYGAGGFGREVAWLIEHPQHATARRIVAFISDGADGTSTLRGVPVLDLATAADRHSDASVVLAIGNGDARLGAARRALDEGLALGSAISPGTRLEPSIVHGEGLVICQGSIVTVDVTMGLAVQINLNCTIGHDAVLEDGVTLAPGVHVSGNVVLERGAYVGTGAVIINGAPGRPIVIGRGAIVGAGAVVTRDVPAMTTVVGSPAKPIQQRTPANASTAS